MFLAGCAERQEETEELVVFEEIDKECESNSAEELPGNTLLKIDYHLFDFNDDGLEDYVVCLSSSEYSGSAGNTVYIYIQEPDGKLSEVTV